MSFEEQKYHEVFVPLTDVFDEGGPDSITEFQRKKGDGRNLVVTPLSLINELGKKEENNSYGASAALRYIKSVIDDPSKRLNSNLSDLNAFRIFESSLDFVIVNDLEKSFTSNMAGLNEKLKNLPQIKNAPITFVSSKNAENISMDLSSKLLVKQPEFLITDETIIEKGIIMGNYELYAALQKEPNLKSEFASEILETDLLMNQFVRFPSTKGDADYAIITGDIHRNNSEHRIIGVDNKKLKLIPREDHSRKLHYGNKSDPNHFITNTVLGIKPYDMEQYLALQYGAISRDISLFFLCGKQGSGKTVLTYAHAIDSILSYDKEMRHRRGDLDDSKDGRFKQVIIMKAPEILGGKRRDPGALPGDLFMKLKHFLASYKDSHSQTILSHNIRFEDMFLHPKFMNEFGGPRDPGATNAKINDCARLPAHEEAIELVYSGFIGGRSKPNTLFVLDEAQDYTPYEMKTILERLAIGSSAIVLGDPYQTRNPQCTIKKNGLTFALKNYLGKPYVSLLNLPKNYRSQVSEDSGTMRVWNP